MHNGYGAGHVFCLSKAETVTEISVAFEFGMGFVAAGVLVSGGALFSQKVILYLNQFSSSEIEEDSNGLEAEGIGDIMIHEDCL
ncbi:hypothetical protein YC2023_108810 [Brassica napus]